MSVESIITLLIPLCVVSATWLALTMIAKSKKRRIKRTVEQGVADYLARFDSELRTRSR
jgi:hypothetical protein